MKNKPINSPKIYKYNICIFIAILQLQISFVSGQKKTEYDDLRSTLNFMFEHLDKKKVPTGLLRDYAIEEEDLDLYTGKEVLTEKNKITIVKYSGLLNSIKSSALYSNPIKNFESTIRLKNKFNSSNIRLSIMAFEYAQIKPDALTSGLIKYTNGQVENADSVNSPYQIRHVFAGCCLDYVYTNRVVSFILPKEYILTNTNCQNFELDYGKGFIPLLPSKPINATLNDGENKIIIKAKLGNGNVLITHTAISIQSPDKISTRSLFIDSRYSPDIVFSKVGKAYNGVQTSAKISVKYGYGHSEIVKPFIFVEGFDPRCLNPTDNGLWNFKNLYRINFNSIEDLRFKGYDIIYVDWDKSEEYIQANANVLIDILDDINTRKSQFNSNQSNVIMGHSMGGLIARYALKKMENENKKHEVETYISYDSPHLGAHIPLGVLYGFHGVMKFIKEHNILTSIISILGDVDITKYIQYGESLAYSTAAQQMLVFYVDPAGIFNNNVHNVWQRELNTLGFPKGDNGKTFNMLAISNGDYNSINTPNISYLSTTFTAESDLLHLIPWLSSVAIGLSLNDVVAGLLNILPGRTSIEGKFELYPAKTPNQQVTSINMKYKKKFLWIVPITKTVFSYDRYFMGGYLFDNYPSSVFKISNTINSGNNSDNDLGIPIIGEFRPDIHLHPYIPFIPVSSALSYGDGLNSSSSYFTTPPPAAGTPFGDNYLLQSAEGISHSILTDKALNWLIARLEVSITGPNVGMNGTQYSLSKSTGNITWSTSDSNIATINQQGIISIKGKGIISVIATYNNIKYSKKILVGLPRFVLSASHEPGGYKIKASCIDSYYSNHLSDLNNAISYYWGVKFPNKNIKWVETESQDLLVQLEEGNQEVIVFLKITDKLGNSTTTQSIKVSSKDIYVASNQKLYITANGNMYDDLFERYSYSSSRIYIDYVEGLSDEYKKLKWMVTSAKVISPFSTVHNIPFSESGPQIRDVIPQSEFDYIKNGSNSNQTYTYMLILLNAEELAVQYFPIVFTYKENI